jgi:mannan endo-1,4-beta-mannosidase
MPAASGFVQRFGAQLLLQGAPFPIVGANNYYFAYVPEAMQNGILDMASALGLNTLRIWAFLDTPAKPSASEISFQYWDPAKLAPVINEGDNGLVRLDRAIAKIGERGIRLILTLTNNWKDFGGMPQYVAWFGMDPNNAKNKFYTDDRCSSAYLNWIRHIVSRRNTITGHSYSDEPAILAWELANEPRCEGRGGVDTLTGWIEEMSTSIRLLDANHLICSGDEGYFKHALAWGKPLYNGEYGVDCEQILDIASLDFGTMHMYPKSTAGGGDPVEFGLKWIREHIEAGQRANKPMLIEEYGMKVGPDGLQTQEERNACFEKWLKSIEDLKGVGDLLWMMGLPKADEQPYDPDEYTVTSVDNIPAVQDHAARMLATAATSASSGSLNP